MNAEISRYEYGIVLNRRPDPVHRSGMTAAEAKRWMDDWLAEGGRAETFSIVRRAVSDWSPIPQAAAS